MSNELPHVSWASERHLRVEVAQGVSPQSHARVRATVRAIEHANPLSLGIVDIVPAYATVLLAIDLPAIERLGAAHIERGVRLAIAHEPHSEMLERGRPGHPSRLLEIPVCYAPRFALDLADVAAMQGIHELEVISVHTSAEYLVYFVGFSPGFAYMGGLPRQLETPRLDKPRVRVPPGSVAIAGSQAGVYPRSTPGGWRILGRTPLRMFDAHREPASLLAMGDRVRFVEIGEADFDRIERELRQTETPRDIVPNSKAGNESQATANPSLEERLQIRVLDPGLFTTIQDLGRPGHASIAVPESGAADPHSLRLANRLLGNDANAAALELTLKGGEYEFMHATSVCVTGASMPISIHAPNSVPRSASLNSLISVGAGERLRFGFAARGARAYLAVQGGFDVPGALGSRSTLVNAALGGHEGRTLQTGDVLRVRLAPDSACTPRPLRTLPLDVAREERLRQGAHVIRIVDGAHAARFLPEFLDAISRVEFAIASNSDRMGVRLQGPPIQPPGGGRLLSEGMMSGAIQITESGQPIILMPDHPTTGGYPVIACVIAADLPALGQLRPNDRVQFERVTRLDALRLWMQSEHRTPEKRKE